MVDILGAARKNPELYEAYFAAKKLYKTEIRKSKKCKNDKELEELRQIKNINEAWKYLKYNKGSSSTRQPEGDEMFKHFFELLEGVKEQPECALFEPNDPVSEETLIGKDEMNEHLEKMKTGKAEGPDKLKAEALKYVDDKSKEAMRTILNSCLKGVQFPVGSRKARIHPIYKKGDPSIAARGIAIGNSMYKLYASILCST